MSRSTSRVLTVALALATTACAGPKAPPAGAGFGLAPPGAPAFDPNAVKSSSWDVAVTLSPAEAQVHEEDNQWSLTSSDDRGALTVMVMRDPGVNDAWVLAELLRKDRADKGEDVTELSEDMLVGHRAARWVSVGGDVATLVLVAHQRPCVYLLIASSKGTSEEIVAYFQWAASLVRSTSGRAAHGPACRQ
jgi:hypothetical protein